MRIRIGFIAFVVAMAGCVAPAAAIPVFAHRYGLTCQACHTEVPHLTAFGEQFLARGYRLPGVRPKNPVPIAVKTETAYSSAGNGPGLPKAIVDEVEVLAGGAIGSRTSYFAETYVVDGGLPGHTRDAWLAYQTTRDGAQVPFTVRAGQFTLPLPIDPETFRETTDHYAIWDQTAGGNPFQFFLPKIGVQFEGGDPARQLSGTVALLDGHDTLSGLPRRGIDTMVTLARDVGRVAFRLYRYDGTRTIAPAVDDRFWRTGFGVGWEGERTRVDAVYQSGNDTAADVFRDALQSSGGFVQVRRELGPRMFAIARWDATQDARFARSVIAGAGYRISRNTRLTVFGTATRNDDGTNARILSSSLLVAY